MKILKLICANLLLLLVLCIGLELIFGGYFRDNALSRLNLIVDRTIEYDLNGIYEFPGNKAIYTRDQYGLRGDYPDTSKIDILVLGGSSADQRYVTDGETWPDHMERAWKADGKEIYIANAGVDGQSSYGHLKNFTWWFPHIPNLRPRMILFYVGVNDLFGNAEQGWDDIENRESMLKTLPLEERDVLPEYKELSGDSESWGDYLERNSAILYLYRTFRGIAQAYKVKLSHGRGFVRGESDWGYRQAFTDHFPVIASDLKKYSESINNLIDASLALGARPVIVSQSAHYFLKDEKGVRGFHHGGFYFKGKEVFGVDVYHFLKLYSDVAMNTCKKRKECVAINLFEELQFQVGDFYDDVHNTPQGSKKIGLFLKEKLTPYLEE